MKLKARVELKALVGMLFRTRATAWLLGVSVGDVGEVFASYVSTGTSYGAHHVEEPAIN